MICQFHPDSGLEVAAEGPELWVKRDVLVIIWPGADKDV
jgi:hypothetical protein